MSSDVLVLNKSYWAIHIADWQQVMSLLFKGQAVALDENLQRYNFNEWKDFSQAMAESPSGWVHTPNFRIAIPEVICLTVYNDLPQNQVKFTRKTLYKQYKHVCCYCGNKFKSEDLNLDHILPRSRGGKTEWKNIVLSCIPCNSKKDDNLPHEANMKMHYQPYKPVWRPSFAVNIKAGFKVKQSWQKFIDQAYWNVELQD